MFPSSCGGSVPACYVKYLDFLLSFLSESDFFTPIPSYLAIIKVLGNFSMNSNTVIEILVPAISNTCKFQYLQIPVPANSSTCKFQYLQIPVPANSSTCNFQYLQIPVPAISSTCKFQYLQIQVPPISSTCKFQYLQIPVPANSASPFAR